MPNRIYHEACGQPTEYSLVKPKFCASCGGAFDSVSITPTQRAEARAPKRPLPRVVEEDEEEIDDDDDDFEARASLPRIRKLEVEIEETENTGPLRIPMSSVVGQGGAGEWGARKAPKMTKKAAKAKYQEIFQKLNSRSRMTDGGDEE